MGCKLFLNKAIKTIRQQPTPYSNTHARVHTRTHKDGKLKNADINHKV